MKIFHISAVVVGFFLVLVSLVHSSDAVPRLAPTQAEEDRLLDDLDDTAGQIEANARKTPAPSGVSAAKKSEAGIERLRPEVYKAVEAEDAAR